MDNTSSSLNATKHLGPWAIFGITFACIVVVILVILMAINVIPVTTPCSNKCVDGYQCDTNNKCVPTCKEQCGTSDCNNTRCGAKCGPDCPPTFQCNTAKKCVSCTEKCPVGAQCGAVCGFSCGLDCPLNFECIANKCAIKIKAGTLKVPKPLNGSYSNPQYVYMFLGSPFTATGSKVNATFMSPGTTTIILHAGTGPDALVLEYVIVAFGNVKPNQPDFDTTGRMGNIPVPGIPVNNIPIIYDVVASAGYAMVVGQDKKQRLVVQDSNIYDNFINKIGYDLNFNTTQGKTYHFAIRIVYASDDDADVYNCDVVISQ